MKKFSVALIVVSFVIVPTYLGRAEDQDPNQETGMCTDCVEEVPVSAQIEQLSKTINALDDKSNCAGVLSTEQELEIANKAVSAMTDYMDGIIDDQARIARVKPICDKMTGRQKAACMAVGVGAARTTADTYAMAIAFAHTNNNEPLPEKVIETFGRLGVKKEDIPAKLAQVAASEVPNMRAIASTGARFSTRYRWDFTKFHVNPTNMKGNLYNAMKAYVGEDVAKALADPNRQQAVTFQNMVFLPPNSQLGLDGKVKPGEVRTMSLEEYEKGAQAALKDFQETAQAYMSYGKASATLGQLYKQGGGFKAEDLKFWNNWRYMLPEFIAGNKPVSPGTPTKTAESAKADELGDKMSGLMRSLLKDYGIEKNLGQKIGQATMQAHMVRADANAAGAQNINGIINGLRWAPITTLGVGLQAARGLQALKAAGTAASAAQKAKVLYGSAQMAIMGFGFGTAKSLVVASVESWRRGGDFACTFMNDFVNKQLGGASEMIPWALSGPAGSAIGSVSRTAGAAVKLGTSGYFTYGVAHAAVEQGKAAYDARGRYTQYAAEAAGKREEAAAARAAGDEVKAKALEREAAQSDQLATAAATDGFKQGLSGGFDAIFAVQGVKHGLAEVKNDPLVKGAITAIATTRAAKGRAAGLDFRPNDVFTDSNGKSYQVLEVDPGNPGAGKEKSYLVREQGVPAGEAPRNYRVTQSNLADAATKPNGKQRTAKTIIPPDTVPYLNDAIKANEATPDMIAAAKPPGSPSAPAGERPPSSNAKLKIEGTEYQNADNLRVAQMLLDKKMSDIRESVRRGRSPQSALGYREVRGVGGIKDRVLAKLRGPELSSEGRSYTVVDGKTYFSENGKLYEVTNPRLDAFVKNNIALAGKSGVAPKLLELERMPQSAFEPVEKLPDSAQAKVEINGKNGQYVYFEAPDGGIYYTRTTPTRTPGKFETRTFKATNPPEFAKFFDGLKTETQLAMNRPIPPRVEPAPAPKVANYGFGNELLPYFELQSAGARLAERLDGIQSAQGTPAKPLPLLLRRWRLGGFKTVASSGGIEFFMDGKKAFYRKDGKQYRVPAEMVPEVRRVAALADSSALASKILALEDAAAGSPEVPSVPKGARVALEFQRPDGVVVKIHQADGGAVYFEYTPPGGKSDIRRVQGKGLDKVVASIEADTSAAKARAAAMARPASRPAADRAPTTVAEGTADFSNYQALRERQANIDGQLELLRQGGKSPYQEVTLSPADRGRLKLTDAELGTPDLSSNGRDYYIRGDDVYVRENGKLHKSTEKEFNQDVEAAASLAASSPLTSQLAKLDAYDPAGHDVVTSGVPKGAKKLFETKQPDGTVVAVYEGSRGAIYQERKIPNPDPAKAPDVTVRRLNGNGVTETARRVAEEVKAETRLAGGGRLPTTGDTAVDLVNTVNANDKYPAKRKLANLVYRGWLKSARKFLTSDVETAATQLDAWVQSKKGALKGTAAGRALTENTPWAKWKSAAEGRLAVEQAVHELKLEEVKDIIEAAERDPKVAAKVEEAIDGCVKGAAAGASNEPQFYKNEREFLAELNVFVLDVNLTKNSCAKL